MNNILSISLYKKFIQLFNQTNTKIEQKESNKVIKNIEIFLFSQSTITIQMSSANKNFESSRTNPTANDKSQKSSPKDSTVYMPSFTGISSSSTFQQTNNRIKVTQQSSVNMTQSMTNLQDFIMVNDGVEYIFDFTHAQIDNDDIFDIFQNLSKEQEFQMIEREENYCISIKQVKNTSLLSKMNITEWFAGCFPFLNDKSETARISGASGTYKAPSAVKIVISKVTHDHMERKIARIKGLSGLVKQIRIFIEKFKQKITHYLPQQSQRFMSCFFYDPQKETEHQNKKSIEHSDPYHLEISTFYMIQKILSNDIYEIGAITHSLMSDYLNTFQNIEESVGLIPQPINNATKIVNEIYYWFTNKNQQSDLNKQKLLNKSKSSKGLNNATKQQKSSEVIKKIPLHESMTPFIRISIEKYVFQRLNYPIVDIYRMKNQQNEQIFIGKRTRIFEKYSTRQILEQISLNQKFWSIDSDHHNDIDHVHTRKQTRALIKMSTQCCAQIQKIPLTSNPRQKIKHMQLAYTSLKTFFFDYSKHKYELSSMEDIIPVLIMIVLIVNVENLRKQLDIMGDFIQCDPYEMESQKRLYINLSESYNYVLRDWKV